MNKVSVIVPVYNVKNYLEKCIKSIVNQTEKNIQIIIIDDGSTDGSSIICDELAKTDERIAVYHKKIGGLSSARNLGIEKSEAEYVCFIDSDDIIAPYYVEHLLGLIEKYNCDISVGRFEHFTENEPVFVNTDAKIEVLDGKDAVGKLVDENYVNATISCNKIYKKSLFDDVKFPIGLINEDEATTYKLFYKSKRVTFSNSIIYGYYVRPNSITQSRFSEKNFDFLQIAWDRYKFFEEKGEKRYSYPFLKIYCWSLMDFSKKTKKILKDHKKSRLLIKEFKKKSKMLAKTKQLSFKKRLGLGLIRMFPSLYFLIKK